MVWTPFGSDDEAEEEEARRFAQIVGPVVALEKQSKLNRMDEYLKEIQEEGIDFEESLVKEDRKGDSKELYEAVGAKVIRYDDSEVARKFAADEVTAEVESKYR